MKVNSCQERSENVLSGIHKPGGPKSRPGKKGVQNSKCPPWQRVEHVDNNVQC